MPIIEELGKTLREAAETGKLEEINSILKSSRSQEITMEDFTKAFQNMASMEDYDDKPYHVEAFFYLLTILDFVTLV